MSCIYVCIEHCKHIDALIKHKFSRHERHQEQLRLGEVTQVCTNTYMLICRHKYLHKYTHIYKYESLKFLLNISMYSLGL